MPLLAHSSSSRDDYGFTSCLDPLHEKMVDAIGPECNRVIEERDLPEGQVATSEEVADIIKTAFARCEDLFLGGEQPFQI